MVLTELTEKLGAFTVLYLRESQHVLSTEKQVMMKVYGIVLVLPDSLVMQKRHLVCR